MKSFVRVDDRWALNGLRVVTLENELLRVDVVPDAGGKIHSIVHKATQANMLWHNPRLELRAASIGSSYDDNFCGGWEELFPNDAAGRVGDEVYPDHGELWCQPWAYRIESSGPEEVRLALRRAGTVTPTLVEKWLSLRPGESMVRVRYRITNQGPKPLDFLFKLHPALAIEAGDRIDVSGRTGEIVDPAFGRVREPREFPWPVAAPPRGEPIDLSLLPAMDGDRDFVYVRDLSAGWCAIRRMQLGIGFALTFPTDVFSSVWLFMTYGGWRGLQTVVLEPCNTIPKDLNVAIQRGTCGHLTPGAVLDCEVGAHVFEGTGDIAAITNEGRITRR